MLSNGNLARQQLINEFKDNIKAVETAPPPSDKCSPMVELLALIAKRHLLELEREQEVNKRFRAFIASSIAGGTILGVGVSELFKRIANILEKVGFGQ